MQATISSKQFNTGRMKNIAIALIFGSSVIAGAAAVALQRDNSPLVAGASRAAIVVAGNQSADIRFMEDNVFLPTGAAISAQRTTADIRFMEDNLYLPTNIGADAPSYTAVRDLELNLWLPTGAAPVSNDRQLLDDNSWGTDFTFVPALSDPHLEGVR